MNTISTHFKIIRCLQQDDYSLVELSMILKISESKLRKYLNELEDFFQCKGIDKLSKKTMKLPDKIEKLRAKQSFTTSERLLYIVLNFLGSNTINLTLLSYEIDVTRRTIANDLVNLKEYLQEYNLTLESSNSKGVVLKGQECDKKFLFKVNLFKVIEERNYLPKVFEKFYGNFEITIAQYGITNYAQKILRQLDLPYTVDGLLNIELIYYISAIRQLYFLESKDDIFTKNTNYHPTIEETLDEISFFTKYDKNSIILYCNMRSFDYILENESQMIGTMRELLDIFNKKFNCSFELNKEIIIQLYNILKYRELKLKSHVKDFYLYNKNITNNYRHILEKIGSFITEYFEEIDNTDAMYLSIVFIELFYQKIDEDLKKIKGIVIVYKFFNLLFLKKLGILLGLDSNVRYLYYNIFKNPEELQKFTHIIVFEDIEIPKGNYKIMKFFLPVTQLDKLRLKDFLEDKVQN